MLRNEFTTSFIKLLYKMIMMLNAHAFMYLLYYIVYINKIMKTCVLYYNVILSLHHPLCGGDLLF